MKKGVIIVIIILIIIFILFVGYYLIESGSHLSNTTNETCINLKTNLDNKITGIYNHPGNFVIESSGGIVGGVLENISKPYYYIPEDENQSIVTYTLIFKGVDKQGELYLRTNSNQQFIYQVGKFYRFDLSNRRQNGMLSGVFLDINQTALQPLTC